MDSPGDFFRNKAIKSQRPPDFIQRLDEYVAALNKYELPILFSPLHWALAMGMEYKHLISILDNREKYYRHFRIPKKRDGFRYISAPQGELLKIQYWIKKFILDKLIFPEYLTSYQRNKSIIQNAQFHIRKELIVKYDFENFFEDITQKKVYGLFKFLGYNSAVAIDLAKACCINVTPKDYNKRHIIDYSCLPQGAPTSPTISNLAAYKVDLRLASYAQTHNCSYSRYADDITFSGDLKNKLPQFAIRDILRAEGFKLNVSKTKYIQRSNAQLVTGLTVNEKVAVTKKHRRIIHTHLHNCVRFGPYYHLQKINGDKLNYREWLWGNILFIKQLHPKEAEKMIFKFQRINWL